MNSNQKLIFELASTLAVVASLLFVGTQLYLDRKVALSEQYFNRAESRMETLRNQIASEDYLNAMVAQFERGDRPGWWDENSQVAKNIQNNILSVKDFQIYLIQTNLNLVSFDNLYYQYNQGFINEEIWLGVRVQVKASLGSPIALGVLSSTPLPVGSLINQMVIEIENE